MELLAPRWGALEALLKPLLPRSAFAYNWLRVQATGRIPAASGARLFVDRWPEPGFVYASIGEPLNRPSQDLASIFPLSTRLDETSLTNFLRSVRRLGGLGKSTILHSCFCPGLTEALKRVGPGVGLAVEEVADCQGLEVSLTSPKFGEFAIKPVAPEGYVMQALKEEEAELVASTWSSGYIQEKDLWRDRLMYMPSRALVEKESGRVAAFATFSPVGFPTHGWTHPELRGRGLIRNVMMFNAASTLQMRVFPLAFVKTSNKASAHAMRQSGIFVETPHRLDILRLRPENSAKL